MVDKVESGESRRQAAGMLEWIVGILVAVFIVGLAWLIATGGVTSAAALWGDMGMIVTALVGLILIIIAAAMGRY